MTYCDSHVHIGNSERTKKILKETTFSQKYRLYSAVNPKVVEETQDYISNIKDFFAIPIVFKETDIELENMFVRDFCTELNKGIPVELLNTNNYFLTNKKLPIFKEHFLLHNYEKWMDRSLYYEYLNEQNGYLIIHSKDRIRISYIHNLIKMFPHINIIIAHLGRDILETSSFIENVLLEFKNYDNVYFDISTIYNIDNIQKALKLLGSKRILYGSDFPYEFNYNDELTRINQIRDICESETDFEDVMDRNYEYIKRKIYQK